MLETKLFASDFLILLHFKCGGKWFCLFVLFFQSNPGKTTAVWKRRCPRPASMMYVALRWDGGRVRRGACCVSSTRRLSPSSPAPVRIDCHFSMQTPLTRIGRRTAALFQTFYSITCARNFDFVRLPFPLFELFKSQTLIALDIHRHKPF